MGLAGPSFGFGAETTMVMMRLIVSGTFDAFPKLKIVLGTDFPFEDMRVCMDFLEEQSLTRDDKAQLYTKTAASLGVPA